MEIKTKYFNYINDLNKQRELFKDCFPETLGETIQEEKHYFWKFHSYPNNPRSFEYGAYLDNELIGYYAAIPYKYKIGKKIISAGMVCDVMTSSKYRGKGVFTKLGLYATNEMSNYFPFITGYPIRKEVLPGHLKIGWINPFNLPLYINFLRLDSLLESKNIKFLKVPANGIIKTYNKIFKTITNNNYKYIISNNINDIIDYDNFIKEWSKSVPNALIKSKEFIRWRYSAPERKYNFLSIYDNNKMIGFTAYRKIIRENIPSFGIIDFMVLPGYNKSCEFIINTLKKFAIRENVEAIITMMSKTSAKKYKLIKNGFFRSPYIFKLIIKILKDEYSNEELFNENKWHLMWVDSDDL